MSLLDDLEKEAQAARHRRAQEQAAGRARTAVDVSRLAPALERAHTFFSRLGSQLNDLDRQIGTDFHVPGVGELRGLVQQNYRVWTQDEGELRPVGFRFDCLGEQALEASFDSEAVVAMHGRAIRDAGLQIRQRQRDGRHDAIVVAPAVPVSLTFSADREQGELRLATRNLFGMGVQTYRFRPERIDGPFLEALAKLVLREPSRFAELSGNAVADGSRAALRKQLGREKRRRDAELGGALRRAMFPVVERFRRLFLGQ